MKQLHFIFIFCVGFFTMCFAQNNVGIGTASPHNSAIVDMSSTSKGVLIPRLTYSQKDAITGPAKGLLIYQTSDPEGFYYNKGTGASPIWVQLGRETRIAFATNYVGDGSVQVPGNNDLAVPFATEMYDLENNYITNGSFINPNNFIAPATGLYHFDATITWFEFSTGIGNAGIKLKLNGTEVHQQLADPQTGNAANKFSQQMSIDLYLHVGDRVQLCAFQTSGLTQYLASGGNWFSGHIVFE